MRSVLLGEKYAYSTLLPLAGSLVGGIVWLSIYSYHYGAIDFDGPAGGILFLSVSTGTFLGSLLSLVLAWRQKIIATRKMRLQFIIPLVLASVLSGGFICFAVGTYAMNHFKDNHRHLHHSLYEWAHTPRLCNERFEA